MNELRILSANRKKSQPPTYKNPHSLKPYRHLPFSPLSINRSIKPSSTKINTRKVAAKQIEKHFGKEHNRYKNRENHLSSQFKISTKKAPNTPQIS